MTSIVYREQNPASPRWAYTNLRRQPTTDLDELALVLIAWWYND